MNGNDGPDGSGFRFSSQEQQVIGLTSSAIQEYKEKFESLDDERLRAVADHNLPRVRDRVGAVIGIPTERALKHRAALEILHRRGSSLYSENPCFRKCPHSSDYVSGERLCWQGTRNGSYFKRVFGKAETVHVGGRCIHPGALYPREP